MSGPITPDYARSPYGWSGWVTSADLAVRHAPVPMTPERRLYGSMAWQWRKRWPADVIKKAVSSFREAFTGDASGGRILEEK